jgi:aldehyde:ferredoxin oxidoreductase
VCHMNRQCNSYGMDTISTGVTLGLAYHLFEKGIIGGADTEGLTLQWGDPEPAILLIEKTARREGLGKLLAEGTLSLARHFGVEELAAQVNGLEVGMHDPRTSGGVTLSYLTSPRGACHNKSDVYWLDVGRTMEDLDIGFTDRFEEQGKAELVVRHQNWRSACDALVSCIMPYLPSDDLVAMLSAATGSMVTKEDLLRTGERILNLKRLLNLRWGLDVQNERLPGILMEPLSDGGTAGYVPDVERLLTDYYRVRQWDRATGRPNADKLQELGLQGVAGELR